MANFDDLVKGLTMLDAGVKELAIGNGIRQAQEQVTQINQAQMEEMQRRQALTQVSNNLVLQLSGVGADPTQVSQAAGAVAPAKIGNSQDALTQGALTGSKQLTQLGQTLQRQENANANEQASLNREHARGNLLISTASNENIARMNNQTAAERASQKAERLPTQVRGKFDDSKAFRAVGVDLLNQFENDKEMQAALGLINKSGLAKDALNRLDSKRANAIAKAKRYFNAYRRSITGAAASESELAALEEAVANIDDNPRAFMEKLREHLSEEEIKHKELFDTYTQQGFNLAGYEIQPLPQKQGQQRQSRGQVSTPTQPATPAFDINKYMTPARKQ